MSAFFFLSMFFRLLMWLQLLQSAKTNLNVENVFLSIAKDIKQRLTETDTKAEAVRTTTNTRSSYYYYSTDFIAELKAYLLFLLLFSLKASRSLNKILPHLLLQPRSRLAVVTFRSMIALFRLHLVFKSLAIFFISYISNQRDRSHVFN